MNANLLYERLEKDFKVSSFIESWPEFISSRYVFPGFLNIGNGIMFSNSLEITKVYTAVFPSREVINAIIGQKERDLLIVTHHPMEWDVRNNPPWINLEENILFQLKERRISIYSMHLPIDVWGSYSTAITFAKKLGVNIEGEFFTHEGVKVAVYGKCPYATVEELGFRVSEVVGHKIRLFPYGEKNIANNKIGVIPGGRPKDHNMQELVDLNINTLVTGIGGKAPHTEKDHLFAEEKKINILGATHYSTEMFACIELLRYFKGLGIPADFVKDSPVLEDSNIK